MPVPLPGRNFVPRCRTRIIPALTSWPANIFTPSIFGFESRPLREEPSPFLCAIGVRLLGRRGLLLRGRLGRRRPRLRLLLRLGLRRGRAGRLLADRRDLDLREARPVAVVPLVARPL